MQLEVGQQRLRRVAVRRDLRLQRLHSVEFRLAAEEGVEGDVDLLPVEVAGEVEEMRFEQFPGRIEAGADAEVGGAFEDAAIGKVAGHRVDAVARTEIRSEEHTSELQSLMRIAYAVFCLKKKKTRTRLTCMKI